MLVNKVIFTEDFRCYEKGEEVVFKDNLTVVTGDNGTGKSTLLGCVRQLFNTKWSMSNDNQCQEKIEVVGNVNKDDNKVIYLDLSSDLYKNASEFDYDNMNLFMQCRKVSSGQGVIFQLVDIIKSNIETADMIIIDEPERGLSISNQYKIANMINKFVTENPNVQFIVTTHSEAIFSITDELWSTSHKKLIDVEEYMKYMLLPEM